MFPWWASTTLDWLCTATQGSLTVRQPFEKMGAIAARILLKRLEDHGYWVPKIAIEPELAVRDLTGPAPTERTVARNGSFAANHAWFATTSPVENAARASRHNGR
jgi:hypothetical protein